MGTLALFCALIGFVIGFFTTAVSDPYTAIIHGTIGAIIGLVVGAFIAKFRR